MLEHRAIRGDWMGAIYGASGKCTEWTLSIASDGCYQRILTHSDREPENESGTWTFNEESDFLSFTPDSDALKPHNWKVLDFTQCERANTLLILRPLIVGSRILPIVLYRVHHKPFDA
jgi:hypothetical protein